MNVNQDTKSSFQAKDAARLISSTSSDVARLGQIITPDFPSDGRGHKSFYSFRNLVEMELGGELGHLGISWKKIGKYIEALRKSHGRWLEKDGLDGWLVLDRFWKWGAGTTLEMAMEAVFKDRPRDSVIAINVGMIKKAIRRRGEGDLLTGEKFNEIIKQIQEAGEQFNKGRS